jgi:hypothetical protein
MENKYDFLFTKCNCTVPESDEDDHNSTSSENEEDYYSFINCNIDDDEISQLFKPMNHIFESLRPFIDMYDNRLMDIINLWDTKSFFVNTTGKIPYLQSLPYSYFPLMKKPIENKDPLAAPSYMSEKELIEFTKVFQFSENYFKRYKESKGGFSFRYDLENKADLQSIYIYHQRRYYEQLLKERTLNKKKKKVEDDNVEVEFKIPVTAYEPVTIIKRFCDVFTYLCATLDQIYLLREDDESLIKKFTIGLCSGFHLVMASQGIPLPGLIGETYTVENKKNELIMFAEVKNDNPLKIVYNIRWRGRTIMIDGNVDLTWSFSESKDDFYIHSNGYNSLRIKLDNKYKLFTFNLPMRATFKGIVDSINMNPERNMTVDSFLIIKGEESSGLSVFNQKANVYLFDKFLGYMTKPLINMNDAMNTGHTFVSVIFHNSGFNFDNLQHSDDIQQFIFSKTDQLEFNVKKIDVTQNEQGRYIQVGPSDYVNGKNKKETEDDKIEDIDIRSDIKQNDHADSFFLSSPKREKKSPGRKLKSILFKKLIQTSEAIGSSFMRSPTIFPTKGKTQINKNPKRKHQKSFSKFIAFIAQLIKSKTFANYFSPSFVRKILCGSWVNLNFFEISYNNNINNEMLPVYLKFDKDAVRVHPSSRFNEKKGFRMLIDDFKYYTVFHRVFENLWDPIDKPLINDTRYREDLLWLLRYTQQVKNKVNDNTSRIEAFINSSKYKELLDTYVLHNISLQINKSKLK